MDPDKTEELAALTPFYQSPAATVPAHWGGGMVLMTLSAKGECVDFMKWGGGSGRERIKDTEILGQLEEVAKRRVEAIVKLML